MGAFIVYMLKAACLLTAFYLFYKVLLSRDTFFRFNRLALLGILVLSFVLPAIEISVARPAVDEEPSLSIEALLLLMQYGGAPVRTVPETIAGRGWSELLAGLYIFGMLCFLIRFIVAMGRMYRLIHQGTERRTEDGLRLVIHHDATVAPFSWMNYIVLFDKDLHSEYTSGILAHERAHVRHRHSLDVIFAEWCVILQWFNPAAWLLKRELQYVHEFEADEAVLESGINARQYQLLLIKKAVGARLYSVANSINHSSLKKRIAMMIKKRSARWNCAKYLYILPLATLGVLTFARPEISHISEKIRGFTDAKMIIFAPVVRTMPSQKAETTLTPVAADAAEADSVYVMAEQMPAYPGGEKALATYLASHLKASEETEGKSGRVIIQFVVRKDGQISDVHVVRSVSEDVDAEAVRAVKVMPKWIPARQQSKKVSCKFTLPVTFGKPASKSSSLSEKVLVVVDGTVTPFDDLKKISPDKIESMTGLKNAQAIGKYGDKGKDGVIEIVTKK